MKAKARGAPKSADKAIASFRAAWVEEVVPGGTTERRRELIASWSDLVAKDKLSARKVSCADAARLVRDTLGPGEASLALFSTTAALDQPGDCWAVQGARAFNSVVGYLDASSGALLFAWMIPEG